MTVQLTGEVAKKATNTRKFVAQNIAMYEILIQVQGQRVFQVPKKCPRQPTANTKKKHKIKDISAAKKKP